MTRFAFTSILLATLTACATGSTYLGWDDETVAQLQVGISKAELVEMFGEPVTKSASPEGELYAYKRPSDENTARNAYIALVSLGGNTGANATVVDILEVTLQNGAVTDFRYTENTNNSYNGIGER